MPKEKEILISSAGEINLGVGVVAESPTNGLNHSS